MKVIKLKKLYKGGADVRDYQLKKLEEGEVLRIVYNEEYMDITKDVLNKDYPKTYIKSVYGQDYNLITIPWRPTGLIEKQLSLI